MRGLNPGPSARLPARMYGISEPDMILGWGEELLLLRGPFSEQQSPDGGVPHVIWPCFEPSIGRRFLRPESWELCSAAEVWKIPEWRPTPCWTKPDPSLFFEQVKLLEKDFSCGMLKKLVPVYVWKAQVNYRETSLLPVLRRLLQNRGSSRKNLEGLYAWRKDGVFCVGDSPELLLSVSKDQLETMALAGTAPISRGASLFESSKDRIEHDWVVRAITESLLPRVSSLDIAPLALKETSTLAHLFTAITAKLSDSSAEGFLGLLQCLHPTPALGCYPGTDRNMTRLLGLRNEAGVDNSFGAPIGCVWQGQFKAWVAIRNIMLRGEQLHLHTGCGVVSESVASLEWEELKYKKEAICRNYSMTT